MVRIALVASREAPDLGDDGPRLAASFDALGIETEVLAWGSGPDWGGFDAALIRTTWDYVFDRPAFLQWAADVAARTRLANSLEFSGGTPTSGTSETSTGRGSRSFRRCGSSLASPPGSRPGRRSS